MSMATYMYIYCQSTPHGHDHRGLEEVGPRGLREGDRWSDDVITISIAPPVSCHCSSLDTLQKESLYLQPNHKIIKRQLETRELLLSMPTDEMSFHWRVGTATYLGPGQERETVHRQCREFAGSSCCFVSMAP